MPYADKQKRYDTNKWSERARLNALYRLRDDHPDEYEVLLHEERRKLQREGKL